MSRLVQYRCDQCRRILSDRGPGRPHISLKIMDGSGLAELGEEPLVGWRVTKLLAPRTYHFCDPEHLAAYMTGVLMGQAPVYVNE